MKNRQKIIAGSWIQKPVLDKLKKKYDVFHVNESSLKLEDNKDFINHLQEVEGIIGLSSHLKPELLDLAPNLKVISNVSVGYNNLNIDELSKRNIMATHTPGVLTDTVADVIFGLLIATARQIPRVDQYVKSGQWKNPLPQELYGLDVHHKTLGVIGMGRIGQAIAKRAHLGFDMNIMYYNRSRKQEVEYLYDATFSSLEDVLKQSDFVLLMTPLTKETEGLLGKEQFELMKESAIFINGSRGKTIVEKDLISALQMGEIAAAGLDVFETEPVEPNNPLLNMPNVVTLPHIGSSTIETEMKMSELAAENLAQGLTGKKPVNLINPSVWKD